MSWLRGFLRRDDGAAAMEFAIVGPLLVLLAAGVIQLGSIAQVALVASNAAREGARYAAVAQGSASVAQNAALDYASTMLSTRSDVTLPAASGIQVAVTGSVPGGSVSVTVPVSVSVTTPVMSTLLGSRVSLNGHATMRVSQ